MADHVSMSLDDYIKSQKKTGKMAYGRNRRGPKANNAGPRGGGGGGGAGPYRGGQNSSRGRKGRQANNNNGQGRWNNRGSGRQNRGQLAGANAKSTRGNFQRFVGGGGRGGQGQGQSRRLNTRNRSRNTNRQSRRQLNPIAMELQRGTYSSASRRRFTKSLEKLVAVLEPKRVQARLRMRNNIPVGGVPVFGPQNVSGANKNTKRAFLKLAKKRVQRAKLLVNRRKAAVGGGGGGKMKKVIAATSSGRLALGKNGFVTVKNTKAKRMERALVQMKIARAQQARNRVSPQRNVNINLPGGSGGGKRSSRKPTGARANRVPRDWNPSIVRTMTNDLADEMTSSQLNPDIQRKIAFIQSRAKGDRAPVMPDFKAPVTTSRMKLSDRFRLLRDQ